MSEVKREAPVIDGTPIYLTLGALEKVCEKEPCPAIMLNAFAANIYNSTEIRVVLGAAIDASGVDAEVEDFIQEKGMQSARDLCLNLLLQFFEGIEGNESAAAPKAKRAAAKKKTIDTQSAPT